MLLTVSNFCQAVVGDINGMIKVLQTETGRNMSDTEKQELASSYKLVARMLNYARDKNASIGGVYISTTDM